MFLLWVEGLEAGPSAEPKEAEMKTKAWHTLNGEREHIDELIHFIKREHASGHGPGAIARTLALSYDEFLELWAAVRPRISTLQRELAG